MKTGEVKGSKNAKTQVNAETLTNKAVDFFESLGSKAIWLCLALVLVLSFIVFKDYLLLKRIYLFKDIGSDSLNASWPWMVQGVDYLSKYGFPSWSFNMGMGQNILSFTFYDPFDYILFLFGKQNMIYLLGYKEVFKILVSAIAFFSYLKLIKINNFAAITGTMMYCFCGYMILGSGWFIFSVEVVYAALLLLCFELLYQKGQWYWFVIPIFIICLSRPFNLWMYSIFLGLYVIFRLYQSGEKIFTKQTAVLFAKIIGVSLLGIGVAAPIFLEHLQTIIDSPRGSGPDSYQGILSSAPMFHHSDKKEFGTAMLRFFSSDILGSGINFKGWQNFLEASVSYCGLPCLLLFTQFFQFLNKRIKQAAIVLLAIWLLPLMFPYFRQGLWLFSGDYYRTYSFFVALVFMFFSFNALNQMLRQRKINLVTLISTLVVLLILINYPFFRGAGFIDENIHIFAQLSLVVYAALFYFMVKADNNARYKYAFVAYLFIELAYFSWCTVNRRDTIMSHDLNDKIGYNDYSLDAVKYLRETDKSFYRIDKSYFSTPAIHGSLNDGMVQDYYGTSCYNPFNQKYYINYLKTMGIINKVNEMESRWSPGLLNRSLLEPINSVKYVLSKSGYSVPFWRFTHDSIAKFGDVLVLKNKLALPLGFGYARYLKLSDFEKLSTAQKDYVSTKACVINDEDVTKISTIQPYNLSDTITGMALTYTILKQNLDSLQKDGMQVNDFNPTHIKATVNMPAGRMLYISIPFDRGWLINDNGKVAEKLVLTNGMTGIFLNTGAHSLEFTYTSPNLKRGIILSLITICTFIIALIVSRKIANRKTPI